MMQEATKSSGFNTTIEVDKAALRQYRLRRVQQELRRRDIAATVLYDPINIRYVTDVSNMQVYSLHNPCRYVFVAADGPVVLFDFKGCAHLSDGIEVVDEVRTAISWYHFVTGSRVAEKVGVWADQIDALLTRYGGGNRRIAADRLDPAGVWALAKRNISLLDGQELMGMARVIKSPEEIRAIQAVIAVCEEGMRRMQAALNPGLTENQVWSILHQTNIELGGEWIETRLLTSGPRTNPWYQECSNRAIEAGDFVALDSDLIGPCGYTADISRTWLVGDVKPTDEQRRLYSIAHEQLQRNIELLKPGVSFKEISLKAWTPPEPYLAYMLPSVAHGAGLVNEYPLILHETYFDKDGYDGELTENMALCVESYVGEIGGREGVKLEEQVLVTAQGPILLSTYGFEEQWL